MVKKEILIVLMIISLFLVSACDVYDTLYVKESGAEEAVEVPEEAITIEIEESVEEEEVSVGEVEIDIEDLFAEEIEVEEVAEEEADVEEVETIFGDVVEIDIEDIFIEEVEEVEVDIEDLLVDDDEEILEDATAIIIEETELVSLVPKAEDPDEDVLTFTFTSPLDDNGEWQTTYGDAGEYTVTVTASDGSLTSSKDVLVIVNRKEEAPTLDSVNPQGTVVEVAETDILAFEVVASDLNNDELSYVWKLDGVTIGDENSIEYKTTYEDSGSHTIKVSVSDGIFETEKIWSITVNNVNRKPVLSRVYDIEAKETDTIIVQLEATDNDGDELSFGIDDGRFVQDGNMFTWETTYDDAGEYSVTATVSDGVDTVSEEFTVTVENVNRAPVILDIIQKE